MSIRNTFILILLLCLVVMATGISFAVHFYTAREAETEFARKAAAQLDRVEDIVHIYFKGAEQAAKKLASLPETRAAALVRKTAGSPSQTEDAALTRRLEVLPLVVPGVETAFCGYKDGSFHSSAPAMAPEGYDARTQSWYADTAWDLAEASITGVTISETSKSLVGTMAAKIKDDGGDVLGVAALTVSLAPLTDTLRDIRPGRTGRLVLFDDKGRILFDPKTQENLLRDAADVEAPMPELAQLPAGPHALATGQGNLAAVSRVLDGTHWKAVLLMDKSESTAAVWRLIIPVGLIAAGTLLLLALAGIFFACNATRPLYALISQSKALADGNADALAGIPGRGPDITALQGSIGMLTGRVMLLAQAEKQHAQELEVYARKAFRADQADGAIREAHRAANAGAALKITPIAADAAATAAELDARTSELHGHTREQAQTATDARLAAEALLADAATMARQAAETEKSAEAALLRVQKTGKLARDASHAFEAAEEAANALPPGLAAFKHDAGQMAALTTSVRDIAEEINVLGLNLSIEMSGAGEDAGQFAPITDDMRALAEKIMAVAGSMDNAVAVFDQNQAAHALAVNKNTAAVKRAVGGGAKAGTALAEAAAATATAVEQVRVLSTTLEGLAQPDVISTSNAEAALRTAETAEKTLRRLEDSINAVRLVATRLAALAGELETAGGGEADRAMPPKAKQTA